ncbi:MAG: hypothetical protein ACOC0W_04360 [Desulfosalsimonas sp.]
MSTEFLIAAAAMAGLLIAIHVLEKRGNSTRKPTEQEMLFFLARATETSEFEQFMRAAEEWHVSRQKVESDFNRYLFQSTLPYYVKDYLRKTGESDPALLGLAANCFTGTLLPKKICGQ